MSSPPPSGIIVLDDEDEGVCPPPDPPPSTSAPPPGSPQPNGGPPGSPGPPQSGGKGGGSYKVENERLFGEFLELCTHLTEEHPEVIPFLSGRHQKASPDFLTSAEFRNILSRCLSRVRTRRNKVYVYINELCTVLKAHTLRRKLPLAAAPPAAAPSSPPPPQPPVSPQPPSSSPAAAASSSSSSSSSSRPPGGSKRQIRYLENLLRVYMGEIRRLQERELDLAELDSEDSTYLQESRLKRKMMRIFERLCQLKQCSSLTGRVIEQRIQYRGTRYPEVNRRIERFINRPEAFPDYTDILKVIQKASARHSLGLARRQMESMAQDAFREVGNRLQERRHLDLVYNFGSHLTDQYRPGTDPALVDPELAKRLRKNRTVALTRLDDVISHYAQLQDESEEEERGRKRAARQQGTPPTAAAPPPGGPPPPPTPPVEAGGDGEGDKVKATLRPSIPQSQEGKSREEEEESEDEEDSEEEEEEEEEDDDSSEADVSQGKADEEEEEEEEEAERGDEGNEAAPAQGDAGRLSPPAPPAVPPPRPPLAEEEEVTKAAPPTWSPPHPELFVLEIETLPLEPGETPPSSPQPPGASEATPKTAPPSPQPSEPPPPPPPAPPSPEAVSSRTVAEEPESVGGRYPLWTRPSPSKIGKHPPPGPENPLRSLENGGGQRGGDRGGTTISSTSFNGSTELSPPRKRSRLDLPAGVSPCIEVHSVGSEEEEEGGPGGLPPRPRHSPLPDSTRADSPGRDLVSSSQGSPRRLPHKACKTSVATQCDPEEIIVLSDSD